MSLALPIGMQKDVTILTGDPTIEVIAEQALNEPGILAMARWVQTHRPNCVPATGFTEMWDLLPHNQYDEAHDRPSGSGETPLPLSANEVLCEIAGRTCYHSFAEKAGKKTNKEYFEHIFSMDPLHSSILYHAKMTFFFGGVSRKFSHQFIRNYVGSDRDEEGSPSQESTRFTHHYGFYVAPPLIGEDLSYSARDPVDRELDQTSTLEQFRRRCQTNYDDYLSTLSELRGLHAEAKRKEIYEAAAGVLNMSAETSFVWTTNPMAIRKFLKERCHEAADAEIQRFARKLARICFSRWPNLMLGRDLDAVRTECGL